MTTHIEQIAVVTNGARKTANHLVFFYHGGAHIELVELVGGGETGRAGTDDDDVICVSSTVVHDHVLYHFPRARRESDNRV